MKTDGKRFCETEDFGWQITLEDLRPRIFEEGVFSVTAIEVGYFIGIIRETVGKPAQGGGWAMSNDTEEIGVVFGSRWDNDAVTNLDWSAQIVLGHSFTEGNNTSAELVPQNNGINDAG